MASTLIGPTGARRGRVAAGVLVGGLLGLGLAACAVTPDAPPGGRGVPGAVTEEYLPGLMADIHPPPTSLDGPIPIVLLVPGGGWVTADRTGLTPLANELARAGMYVVNATYSTGPEGAVFPDPAQDLLCAASFAVARARDAGLTPGPLVLIGHSAGAHLAALALRHGDADQTVPLAQSQAFATALETASVPVQLDVLPGIAHAGVYTVDVSAGPTIAWITSTWPTGATAAPQGPRSLGSRPPPEDRSPR